MEVEERHRERLNRREEQMRESRDRLRQLIERMEDMTEEEIEEILRLANSQTDLEHLRYHFGTQSRRA